MKKSLPYLLVLSAISVSISAAYYSIFGLSKLFSGEAKAVIIMASTLEFAKILITIVLHNYWKAFSNWLRAYFTITVIILVIITSQGIYGFLTNAYQQTAMKDMQITKKVELVELKKKVFLEQKDELTKEQSGVITSIENLRSSLGNNVIQSVDKKTGQLIKSTSNETRKSYERQLDDATQRRDKISDKIQIANDSITSLEIQIIQIQNSSSANSELGPLKYLSGLTGQSMDKIVNWFLLLLIIVFDPLAIALILGASSIFKSMENPIVTEEIKKKVDDVIIAPNPPSPIITHEPITELDKFIIDNNLAKNPVEQDEEPETYFVPFQEEIKKKSH